jgi:hypothetical protein
MWAALCLGLLGHGLTFFTYPLGMGPDWTLYLGSALELFQEPIRNPYILMDRNGYYPWLAWVFLHLPRGVVWLVAFQHLVLLGFSLWSVRLAETSFGRVPAWILAVVLSLCPPLLAVAQVTNSEAACLMASWLATAAAWQLVRDRGAGLWPWLALGLGMGLAVLARPSWAVLGVGILAALWLEGLPRRRLLSAAGLALVMVLALMGYNYLRLGYFGTEFKAGRTLFAITWQEDRNLLTSNGPATRRLVRLLRRCWPELAATNPVIQRQGLHINQILDNPNQFPYHLYYLIVNLTRRELPYREADRLLRRVALEAFAADWGYFFRRRWASFLAGFASQPMYQLSFLSEPEQRRQEARRYAAEKRLAFRHVSDLYTMKGHDQSREGFRAFWRDYNRIPGLTWNHRRWGPGMAVLQALYRLLPDYKWLYGFGLLWLGALWLWPGRLGLEARQARPWGWLFMALLGACLANWAFVYLISAGRILHMLAGLHLELVCAGLGLWSLVRLVGPAVRGGRG